MIETTKALAGFLKHFDLRPSKNTAGVKRGYVIREEWVQEWRTRYGGNHHVI